MEQFLGSTHTCHAPGKASESGAKHTDFDVEHLAVTHPLFEKQFAHCFSFLAQI